MLAESAIFKVIATDVLGSAASFAFAVAQKDIIVNPAFLWNHLPFFFKQNIIQ